ncbi:MAG: hypothetical protein ACRDTG_01100 [Pseudonocardiaceae bacterium]
MTVAAVSTARRWVAERCTLTDLGAIHEDVVFNWNAARRLSAQFRAVATTLEGQISQRNTLADQALREWRGAYAEQFRVRMNTCTGDAQRFAASMHLAANQLDELAELARAEQSRRERARQWVQDQENESFLNKVGDAIFGEDDKPPVPGPIQPPRYTQQAPVAAAARG